MSKKKFALIIIVGIGAGVFIVEFLRWLGLDISLANVWNKVLGEPNGASITIVSVVTVLVSYFIILRLYKDFVNFK